jgi:nucleoside-diphosphate-sugar epimerase
MKALVTGSTGFIGSHLVEALLEKKYEVYCFVRENSALRWLKDLDVKLITGAYSDKESFYPAVQGMDYVFHVGAVIDALEWETFYNTNVLGTVNLLEACAEKNPAVKKVVFVSSIAATGAAVDKKPLTEEDECRPVSLYGKSKLEAENAAAGFFDTLPIVILRPTNIFGARQFHLYETLKLLKKRILPLLGNGDKQTSVCNVHDLVRAMILAAENENIKSRTYFVANKEHYSWRGILAFLAGELGHSFMIKIPYPLLVVFAFFAGKIAALRGKAPIISRKSLYNVRHYYWLHDTSRIEKELGFVPQVQFEEGLREIVRYYKDSGAI